jgi:hypothetical protein
MADELMSAHTNQILRFGPAKIHWYLTNVATIKPGFFVAGYGVTNNADITIADVDVNNYSQGQADVKWDQDIDTAYADNTWIPVILRTYDTGTWAFLSGASNETINVSRPLELAAEAGMLSKFVATHDHSYLCARADEYHAASTDDIIIKVII